VDVDSTLSAAEAKRKYGPIKPVNMAPSKREGIRHAFTAEALRCIGADEAFRLEQLLKSGMPADTDIGGKHLYDWAVEMGAVGCQKVLRPLEDASQKSDGEAGQPAGEQRSAVLDRTTTPGEESVSQLVNRLVELDSLARALSSCLDNLAEEVSVCHGLLMMGGGASALAAHVRSLKDLQARQSEELDRCLQEWEECEDELAYWLREAGDRCDDIKTMISPVDELTTRKELYPTPQGAEEEEAQRRQLLAQIAASEHKVRTRLLTISPPCVWLIIDLSLGTQTTRSYFGLVRGEHERSQGSGEARFDGRHQTGSWTAGKVTGNRVSSIRSEKWDCVVSCQSWLDPFSATNLETH
jgi:hypothetical protein